MFTKKLYQYQMPSGSVAIIPAFTPVIPADNLPIDNVAEIAYWVEPWHDMTEEEESHCRTYGFGLRKRDVTDSIKCDYCGEYFPLNQIGKNGFDKMVCDNCD